MIVENLDPTQPQRIGIIIPVCNEEECIGRVLEELLRVINQEKFAVVVGVNGSTDRTAEIARQYPVLVAETDKRGYGHGCQNAIDFAATVLPSLRAYIFFAGDGASDPRDVPRLVAAYEQGYAFVLGARTSLVRNWPVMGLSHVAANFLLALWCGFLAHRWFRDLAPLRLIYRDLFEEIAPCEMTYGWTIEPQIAAAKLGAAICEIEAHERRRLAGSQKVSGVTWQRTFSIGCRIFAAGYRAWLRFRAPRLRTVVPPETFLSSARRDP